MLATPADIVTNNRISYNRYATKVEVVGILTNAPTDFTKLDNIFCFLSFFTDLLISYFKQVTFSIRTEVEFSKLRESFNFYPNFFLKFKFGSRSADWWNLLVNLFIYMYKISFTVF